VTKRGTVELHCHMTERSDQQG